MHSKASKSCMMKRKVNKGSWCKGLGLLNMTSISQMVNCCVIPTIVVVPWFWAAELPRSITSTTSLPLCYSALLKLSFMKPSLLKLRTLSRLLKIILLKIRVWLMGKLLTYKLIYTSTTSLLLWCSVLLKPNMLRKNFCWNSYPFAETCFAESACFANEQIANRI